MVAIDELLYRFQTFFDVVITSGYLCFPCAGQIWHCLLQNMPEHVDRPIGSRGKFLEKVPEIHIFLSNIHGLIFVFDAMVCLLFCRTEKGLMLSFH